MIQHGMLGGAPLAYCLPGKLVNGSLYIGGLAAVAHRCLFKWYLSSNWQLPLRPRSQA